MKVLILLLFLSSCTASLIENQLEPQGGENPYSGIELNAPEYELGDLLLHKHSRLVVKYSCKINDKYFKGLIVDGGIICDGYAGKITDFIYCPECTNYCN